MAMSHVTSTLASQQSHSGGATTQIEDPRPGILRKPTVTFEEHDSSASQAANGEPGGNFDPPILPLQERSGTIETEISRASSKLDQRWRSQTILSFDGGGIRGYSSLLILKEIMQAVGRIEREANNCADSSFYPQQYVSPHDNKQASQTPHQRPSASKLDLPEDSDDVESCRYLPCHYFDYIGGTSTGGLIAIMLGRLRMGIDQCLEEYETFGGEIFGHPRWFSIRGPLPSFKAKYCGKRLQKAVETVVENHSPPQQKSVGAGYFGSAEGLCKTIAVSYCWTDNSSVQRYGGEFVDKMAAPNSRRVGPTGSGAYLFRSYDHWGSSSEHEEQRNVVERNPGPADNIPIWQVARATTAAPTYFDDISIQNSAFGDGALGSNNPVTALFWEVFTMHGNNSAVVDLVVSIGTGQSDPVELHRSGFKKIRSYIKATKSLATNSEDAHDDMEKIALTIEDMDYYRLNLSRDRGLKNMKLDEWKEAGRLRLTRRGLNRRKESTLDKIRRLTKEYCDQEDIKKKFTDIAHTLVQHRIARSGDTRKWEHWATGIRYRCTIKKCDKSQKLRVSKHDLQRHIESLHPEELYGKSGPEKQELLDEFVRKGICVY